MRYKNTTRSSSTRLAKAKPNAFTLVELVALCFLLVLVSLLVLPTLARAQQRAVRTSCQANLKQLGLALQNYASAHNDCLPGPLFTLASPRYESVSTNQLAWFIANETGSPPPATTEAMLPLLRCPAHAGATDQAASVANYVLDDGRGGRKALPGPPFGQPKGPVLQPLTLSQLGALTSPAACWAIADADKGNANPTLAGWNELPYQPIHGQVRNQLYFDWHVSAKRW